MRPGSTVLRHLACRSNAWSWRSRNTPSTLIAGLTEDRARRSLVTALVLLGLDIGASLTGEGTETLQELDALNTLGVEHAQGYALARPTTDRRCGLSGRSESDIRTGRVDLRSPSGL
jgi:predicted signal transduction protein with EAL and GGDEF domain